MGFIKVGKSMKRRKVVGDRGTPTPPPAETPPGPANDAATPPRKTILDFPVDVIYKIFIYAGPGNCLPVTNRVLYMLLRFDPVRLDKVVWRNLSLVHQMIQTWYVRDVNLRLDFALVGRKLAYYNGQADAIKLKWLDLRSIASDHDFRQLTRSLDALQGTVCQFYGDRFVVSDKVLAHRYITAELIDHIRIRGVEPRILGDTQIAYEICARGKYLQFKFKELSLHVVLLWKKIELGTSTSYTMGATTSGEIEGFSEVIDGENEVLPAYNDELWMMNSALLAVTSALLSTDVYYNDSNDLFQYYDYNKNGPHDFPYAVYANGINSQRKFDLVSALQTKYRYQFRQINQILRATYLGFEPQSQRAISLDEITEFVLAPEASEPLEGQTVTVLLKMYHTYEIQDCRPFGTNSKGQTLPQDISKAILKLLGHFYAQPGDKADTDIWQCVVELKNFNLAQVLMQFNNAPEYNILL